jgi:sugar (pentulose or hexulose) kinase
MESLPVILIFDIGKTNKKLLLFDSNFSIVYEKSIQINEVTDEDGYPCENLDALTNWITDSLDEIHSNSAFVIKGMHCAAYGASWVYLDKHGNRIGSLYNYLKPYNPTTRSLFESKYGSIAQLCLETASPDLGNLNSGLQLFRLKAEKPAFFSQIRWALHLPQYIYYLMKGTIASDITSIGCHTLLWDYSNNQYHKWVHQEGFLNILPPIQSQVGLHDSSAALIPYLRYSSEEFVLISTGTWCISMNPFNHHPLTLEEIKQDTLCYLTHSGKPVKASRIFTGKKHAIGLEKLKALSLSQHDFEIAYQALMNEIVEEQVKSTQIVLKGTGVTKIYVDGGFSNNQYYMNGIAKAFPHMEVYAANVPQATSIGAACMVSDQWNLDFSRQFSKTLKRYTYEV